jgi:small-conductance mechanosensitive channel
MLILVLFIVVLGLMLVLKYVIAPSYGDDVSRRFIERINYIPSQKPALLNRDNLAKWLADAKNARAISGYVFPILFPLDVVFLASLGLLLGCASVAMAGQLSFLSNVPAWVWWIFPLCYVAADFTEDMVVAATFKSKIELTDRSFGLLQSLTTIKIMGINLAIGQVGFLAALYALLSLFPATGDSK